MGDMMEMGRGFDAIATDRELVEVCKRDGNNTWAFAELYRRHHKRTFSLCLRMLGDVSKAEDFTQEAFLQLHRKIHTFKGNSAFTTWFHRLTINVVLMDIRKRGISTVSFDGGESSDGEGSSTAWDIGMEDWRAENAPTLQTLNEAISNLAPRYRLIFVLHHIEGYEHNEVAAMLGCSIGNSKSQSSKARRKLRNALRARGSMKE